jgi:hypothetical protein
MMELIN